VLSDSMCRAARVGLGARHPGGQSLRGAAGERRGSGGGAAGERRGSGGRGRVRARTACARTYWHVAPFVRDFLRATGHADAAGDERYSRPA